MNKLFATALAISFVEAQDNSGYTVNVYRAPGYGFGTIKWALISSDGNTLQAWPIKAGDNGSESMWGSAGDVFTV